MNLKKLLKKICNFIVNPALRFNYLNKLGAYKYMSDKKFLEKLFFFNVGYSLNLDSPRTFNEKLQWLKLYDRKPEYTKMVDKYEAKKYVEEKIGSEYIISTLGVWDNFDEIDFDSLPSQFVLKCTHDSGGLVIVKDKSKFDKVAAKRKIEKSLKKNYFYYGREWPYKNIVPRIIAEEYISDSGKELSDYKFMCFNGKVKCSFVCTERFQNSGLKVTFFDREWNVMPFERHYPKSKVPINKPIEYEKMIVLAENLARDIPFVRVDFYEVQGKIFFGELTFFPGTGIEEFTPEEWDLELGNWLEINLDARDK